MVSSIQWYSNSIYQKHGCPTPTVKNVQCIISTLAHKKCLINGGYVSYWLIWKLERQQFSKDTTTMLNVEVKVFKKWESYQESLIMAIWAMLPRRIIWVKTHLYC